jgi:hypothetical protein
MSDFLEQCKTAAVNRGKDPSPANTTKEFGGYDAERRATILDQFDGEKDDSPLSIEEAKKHLERRDYLGMLRRTHDILSRQGR